MQILPPTERRYTTHHIIIHDSYTAININDNNQFDYMYFLYNNNRGRCKKKIASTEIVS